MYYQLTIIGLCLALQFQLFGQQQNTKLTVAGLEKPVEVIVDHWGVPHIYAQTEADLFFAQGYYAASDRLFQFEIWRRQATGTIAEILGPRELNRDIGTRLFKFRGDIQQEMNHYHERGASIISAFVDGVNAYIDAINRTPDKLPIEFQLLGIQPQKWTPEIVISRHQGLLGNIGDELDNGRLVAALGPNEVKRISNFHPGDPTLKLDPKIKADLLNKDILQLYNAYRKSIDFKPEDIVAQTDRASQAAYEYLASRDAAASKNLMDEDITTIGSNNWIIDGRHTQSGYPMMANDPHRRQSAPSLRYMAHLVGPGWHVIGGGEPEIPGISIGHNEHGAWGLTVFRTDAEDLYVYQTNPDNPNQYWYQGHWETMHTIEETIPVKGASPKMVTLKYTRHGPVVFEDLSESVAYAVRCGWLEIGGSPYLASLRMNQATDFESFREACHYSNIPGENMIWADREGHIGWQAVGIAPIRRHWSGLVPVPGDGSHEWDGYLPIKAKPNLVDPPTGIFATANANVTPPDYPYMDAIGFSWSDPFRENRVMEVLSAGKKHSLIDMARLQTDYLSIPARNLVPLLHHITMADATAEAARKKLLAWDFQLTPNSVAAGIYHQWEKVLRATLETKVIDDELNPYFSLSMTKVIEWLVLPDGLFGDQPIQGRDQFLMETLQQACEALKLKLGTDLNQWQLGQPNYKHIYLKHPLSNAVKPDIRKKLDVGPYPRGGNSFTVNNTSSGDNQASGASFRIIVDTGNWDHCLATNSPGQAGNPDDPHYRNLFEIWAKDQFFPLFYSEEKVKSVAAERWMLKP